MMNGGISKASHRRSRAKPSKALQEKLLDAVAEKGAELQSHREQPSVNGGLAQDATAVLTANRQLEATSESDPLPAKRARWTRTDTQPPGVGEKAEQTDKPTLQQPRPKPPKRPYASFLRDSIDSVHPDRPAVDTLVSEWLQSIESEREERCRSDSPLRRLDDPVSRQLTRSAPEMGSTRDADGFVVPPTPASTGSCSVALETGSVTPTDASGRSSTKSLVEDPLYRDTNLAANNIYMRPLREEFPNQIADLVNYVRRDRDSPGPSTEEVWQDAELNELWMGAGEATVEDHFKDTIFPKSRSGDVLDRSVRQPMARHTVPNAGSKLKVSNPVPDLLYGYNRHRAFPQQQAQLISIGTEIVANNQYNSLLYPFFVIEFTGDSGSMWVATNQCLGGSASCVNVAERLNRHLKECKSGEVRLINSAAFSIAISGSEARLYISWKQNELDYYMGNVDTFLLHKPNDYLEFRKYVLNIIDWGKDKRLDEVRSSLDTRLEESRKKTSEISKSRPPPSDSSVTGSKRGKSSSRRRTSGTGSRGSQSSGTNEPYWSWDETYSRWFHVNVDGSIMWAEEEVGQSSVVPP